MFDGDELVNYESTISTLSYLINLQETKLEHENEEETYINQETEQLIEERKEERLQLESLGKLVPITTPTEPVILRIAEQRAVAFPVPLRRKKAETALMVDTRLTKNLDKVKLVPTRTSMAIEGKISGCQLGDRTGSILTGKNQVKARVSKTVEFGMAKQTEVEDIMPVWDDVLLDKQCPCSLI